MNNQNGNADFLESRLSIELTADQKRRAGEKAKNNFGEPGGRRKWSFEDYGADLVLRGQMSGYGRSQRLAKGND
jgi:hypothetical protein